MRRNEIIWSSPVIRHTHASLPLKHGIPAKVIQQRLGHATIGTTLDI
jgi:integrase